MLFNQGKKPTIKRLPVEFDNIQGNRKCTAFNDINWKRVLRINRNYEKIIL